MLALFLLALLAALAAGEFLRPEQVYQVDDGGKLYQMAPATKWASEGALALVSAPTLEACAAACRQRVDCSEFEHCDVQASRRRLQKAAVPPPPHPPLPPHAKRQPCVAAAPSTPPCFGTPWCRMGAQASCRTCGTWTAG